MYEVHVRRRLVLLDGLPELAGKRLGCQLQAAGLPRRCVGEVAERSHGS